MGDYGIKIAAKGVGLIDNYYVTCTPEIRKQNGFYDIVKAIYDDLE